MVHTPQQRRQFGTKMIMVQAVQQIGRKKYGAHGRTDKARVEQWSCALKSVQEMASQPNQPAAYYMYVSVFLSFSRIVLAIQQNLT